MAEGRRKFTKEFKVEAVRLGEEGGRALSQVARDLGVNVGVLGKWCRQLDEHSTDAFPGKGRLMPQEEELRRLKRPMARLRSENLRLVTEIRAVHKISKETYGSPRIHAQLHGQGISCGKHRVARLMGIHGVKARYRAKLRPTTT